MFSLIITIISVALVAALALATLYYGGASFNQGTSKAQAAKIVNQGSQLLGASEIFFSNTGRFPKTTVELVASGYLSSTPVAQAAVSEALADNAWVIPVPEVPVFTLSVTQPEACRAVNETVFGERGVTSMVYTSAKTQCMGESLGSLVAVASRTATSLMAAASTGSAGFSSAQVSEGSRPSASNASAWLITPGAGPVAAVASSTPTAPVLTGNLQVGASALAFGDVQLGQSAVQSVTVSNTGAGALQLEAPSVSGAPDFSSSSGTCGSVLAAGQSCQVNVTFAPLSASSASGSLSLVTQEGTTTVSLGGAGVTTPVLPGVLQVGSSLDFGQVALGQTPQLVITVSNAGAGALQLNTPALDGAAYFTLGSSSCPASLATGQSCEIGVMFTPLSAGLASGALHLVSSGGSADVVLTGTGATFGVLTPAATSVDFGSLTNGQTASRTVSFTNTGDMPVTVEYATLSGSSRFVLTTDLCHQVLAPGQTCTVGVDFTPSSAGSFSGTLRMPTTAGNVDVALFGVSAAALVGELTVSVTTSNYYATPVNGSSSRTFTFSNTGTGPLTFTTLPSLYNSSSAFTVTNNCDTTLAAGASCTALATFSPTNTAEQTGNLVVQADVSTFRSFALNGAGQVAYPEMFAQTGGLVYTMTTGDASTAGRRTWSNADAYCSSTTFAETTGWRLPTTTELQALNAQRVVLGLAAKGWRMSYHWSSTESSTGSHFLSDFNNGTALSNTDVNVRYVTCVKSL